MTQQDRAPKKHSKAWWWAATIPALAVMVAASSSVMVHGYRPLSVHSIAQAGKQEPVEFSFDYQVDKDTVQRSATVELTSLEKAEPAEFGTAYAEKNLMDPPQLPTDLELYKATVAWHADPENPLEGCEVGLRNAEGIEQPVRLVVSPQDAPVDFPAAFPNLCEPEGAEGPMAINPFELDANILPEPSKRPDDWEMTYYFITNPGFAPTELFITWGAPHEVRLGAGS